MREEELLTRKHLALKLKVVPTTIYRYEKKGLPVIYIGCLPRYLLKDVIRWLKTNGRGGEKHADK